MSNFNGQSSQPAVAYVMSRFPRLTETFILREMLELEQKGQRVVILPLLRVQQRVRHHETDSLKDRVYYTPFISLSILLANFYYLRRAPLRYLKLLWSVLKGNFGSANLFFGAVGIFPKSVYLARIITKLGVGHVHAHFATHPALAALIISELTGIAFSVTVHAHDIFVHQAMLGEKLRRARFVAAISEFNKRYLLKLFPELDAGKIRVVRCGIKPENYDFVRQASSENESRGFRVLCVASLEEYKGIEFLIRACAELRGRIGELRCVVVGEGEDRRALEALLAELGLGETVELVGARPQNEVARYLRDADAFVLPSVVAKDGQMEGIPVALMEAMASRLPVVSTKLSGIPELISDGENGLLVEPRDSKALAESIFFLYERPAARRRMGEAGRAKVEREYDLRRNVEKLKSLFDESMRRHVPEFSALERQDGFWDGATLNEVEGKLWSIFPQNSKPEINLHRAALSKGHDSAVFALTLARRDVVVKLHRPARAAKGVNGARGKTHAENEFRALSSLWKDFGASGGNLRVPEPLAILPEQAAVITEKCDGERLDALLLGQGLGRGKSSAESIVKAVGACGEWLAKFHRVTRRETDGANVLQRLRGEFEGDLRTCKKFGFDSRLLDRTVSYFEDGVKFIESIEPVVGQHGDFGPHNIFVRDETITVIDFEGMKDGFLYDDLAYFLCLVQTMPFYRLSSALKRRIREAFLRGYATTADYDARLLGFYQVPVMVKIAAHNPAFSDCGGKLNSLRRFLRMRAYSKWLEERV